jgi:GDPmannose 4,6-dehydratase
LRRAIIVGNSGQDGRILFEARSKQCAVVGLDVGTVTKSSLDYQPPLQAVELQDAERVSGFVERILPDEIYYLAAHHHSSEEHPDEAVELGKCVAVHMIGLVNFLEAIRVRAPNCRLFYAGSSQMFGQPVAPRQDETTPFAPRNPYAITKVAGAHTCALYRERYGVHASVGILYNHESPLRGPRFVTQRIARGARQAKRDPTFKLKLGSLSAVVDWGYAPDYVDAMVRIVSEAEPDDYVIATGEPHTVRDFVEIAFGHLGLDWRAHVEEAPALVGGPPSRQAILVGDATKLRRRTGWRPSVSFEQMVRGLIDAAQ